MSSPPPALGDADDEEGASRRLRLRLLRLQRRHRMWDLLRHVPNIAFRTLRLLSFVLFLLPAFVVFLWHYLTCDRIVAHYGTGRNDRHSDDYSRRRYLDIYGSRTPPSSSSSSPYEGKDGRDDAMEKKKKPIVIFLTGGAWIIGYRMWGTLLGRALVPFGILVVVPDYRNYPMTDISGMVDDVDASVQWTLDHANEYGGDKDGIILVGQSAGAHIGGVMVACKVMDWLRRRGHGAESRMAVDDDGREARDGVDVDARDENAYHRLGSSYSCHQLRGLVMTSCPYDLVATRRVFHRRGLSENLQRGIFGERTRCDDDHDDIRNDRQSDDVLVRWSPYHMVMKCHAEYRDLSLARGERGAESLPALEDIFPKLCIVHGGSDETVSLCTRGTFLP